MRVNRPGEGNHHPVAGSHRVKRPRYGEPVWSAARGRGGGCEGSARARAAAAAAVSATLGAAVATIVAEGSGAAPQAVRTPLPAPSAMDSIMPVSVERPTGARSPSARPATPVAVPVASRPVASRPAAPTTRSVPPSYRATSGPGVTADGVPRVAMSIGRRFESASVTRTAAPTGGTEVARQPAGERRPGAASIGDLHLPEQNVKRYRYARPAGPG